MQNSDATMTDSSAHGDSGSDHSDTTIKAPTPLPPAATQPEPSQEDSSMSVTIAGGSTPAIRPFHFDDLDPRSRCRLPECRNMTSCYDGQTRWCPACGPKSYVRYCSKDHLYGDIKRHHASECCSLAISTPVNEDTILSSQCPTRPYIGNGVFSPTDPHSHLGTVERHRQAVYLALETIGEYFLFNDRSLISSPDDEITPTILETVRGQGALIFRLEIPEDNYDDTRRCAFHNNLLHLLTYGATRRDLEEVAASMVAAIRLSLINGGEWNASTIDHMCLQIGFEFGWAVPVEMTSEIVEIE